MDITELLQRLSGGDDDALNQLVQELKGPLRRIAHRQMLAERKGHTMQTSDLLQEFYMKFHKRKDKRFESRAHFLAAACRAMRQILIDYARKRKRKLKDVSLVPLDNVVIFATHRPARLLDLDAALEHFSKEDPRKGCMAELRVFGGFRDPEIAEMLGISVATVGRDWKFAMARLGQLMDPSHGSLRPTA
jgi:RNA polymerase sigma factor (TIGR02999 family)